MTRNLYKVDVFFRDEDGCIYPVVEDIVMAASSADIAAYHALHDVRYRYHEGFCPNLDQPEDVILPEDFFVYRAYLNEDPDEVLVAPE